MAGHVWPMGHSLSTPILKGLVNKTKLEKELKD